MNMEKEDRRGKPLLFAEKAITSVVWCAGAISTLLILVTFVLTIISVFMRYVVSQPVVWIDQLSGYLLVSIVMFGVAEAYRKHNHIAIDLFTARLTGKAKLIKGLWSDLCVLTFAVILGISTWESIEFARVFGSYTTGDIEIESWIPQSPLMVAAILLGVFASVRFVERIAKGDKS